jgi:hypothetical protein
LLDSEAMTEENWRWIFCFVLSFCIPFLELWLWIVYIWFILILYIYIHRYVYIYIYIWIYNIYIYMIHYDPTCLYRCFFFKLVWRINKELYYRLKTYNMGHHGMEQHVHCGWLRLFPAANFSVCCATY